MEKEGEFKKLKERYKKKCEKVKLLNKELLDVKEKLERQKKRANETFDEVIRYRHLVEKNLNEGCYEAYFKLRNYGSARFGDIKNQVVFAYSVEDVKSVLDDEYEDAYVEINKIIKLA